MVSNNSSSNEAQASGPKPVPDLPCKDPDWWFSAGVAATILFTIGLGWLAGYILSFDFTWADPSQAMQVFQPFLVALAGLVTLCTVVWRGLINEAQAKEQRRQNDAKDMADVGLLLEKATTFLSDESLMKRGVGLAMLDTVVTTPNSPYANFAIELVVDQLVPTMNKGSEGFEAAIQQIETTLERAHNLGIHASRTRTYSFSNSDACDALKFTLSPYLPRGSILGAHIYVNEDFLEWQRADCGLEAWWFIERCRFAGHPGVRRRVAPRVRVGPNFNVCSFDTLQISELSAVQTYRYEGPLTFDDCDFSNADIHHASALEIVNLNYCCFRAGFPPIIRGYSAEASVELIKKYHSNFFEEDSLGWADLMWGPLS